MTLTGARAGRNAIRFYGRVGGHALRPGRSRIAVTATDAAGNRSKASHATFTIARH